MISNINARHWVAAVLLSAPFLSAASAQSNQRLLDAIGEVQNYTRSAPTWRRYLHLEELRAAAENLAEDDLPLLEATVKRLSQDHPGVATKPMVRLRQETTRAAYELLRRRPADASLVVRARQTASSTSQEEGPEAVALRYAAQRWLHVHDPSVDVKVAAQPADLIVWAGEGLFERASESPATVFPVSGRVAGRPYRGTASSNSTVTVHPIESIGAGKLVVRIHGEVDSNTVSTSDGITVASASTLDYDANALLSLTSRGWTATSQPLRSSFNSTITCVQLPPNALFKRALGNRAIAEFGSSRPEARSQAVAETTRVVDGRILSYVDSLNTDFLSMKNRLVRLDAAPQSESYNSGDGGVTASWRVGRVPAIEPPPVVKRDGAATLWVHETAANRLLSQSLPTGQTTVESVLERLGADKDSTSAEPLALDLPAANSLEVFFRDDRIYLMLHTNGLRSGVRQFAPCDLLITLTPTSSGELRRLEPVRLVSSTQFPPRQRLGIRDVSARRIISNIATESFPELFHLGDFGPVGFDHRVLRLSATDGWLCVSVSPD